MDAVTDKQKANRAYHLKNAEKIRARQKAAYEKRTKGRTTKKPVKTNITYRNPEKPCATCSVTVADQKKLKTRRRLEDWKLARELEIKLLLDSGLFE